MCPTHILMVVIIRFFLRARFHIAHAILVVLCIIADVLLFFFFVAAAVGKEQNVHNKNLDMSASSLLLAATNN